MEPDSRASSQARCCQQGECSLPILASAAIRRAKPSTGSSINKPQPNRPTYAQVNVGDWGVVECCVSHSSPKTRLEWGTQHLLPLQEMWRDLQFPAPNPST